MSVPGMLLQRLLARQSRPICACLRYVSTTNTVNVMPKDDNIKKRELYLQFARDVEMTEKEIYRLSPDILDLNFHIKRDGLKCAFLQFSSEKIADENHLELRKKLRNSGVEVEYLGIKRQQDRMKRRLVYILDDPETPVDDIYKLSEDITYVYVRKNGIGRSLAFLDFTTEETKKENLQKLLAMNLDVMEIEGKWLLPEDEDRALYVEFTEIGTTNDDVRDLSQDIIKFKLKRKFSGQSYAHLVFETEEKMEENRKSLQERGLFVDYVGAKMQAQVKETSERTVYLPLTKNTSKDEIQQLSEDIIDVRLKFKASGFSFAFLIFETKELAEQNVSKLQQMGYEPNLYQEKLGKKYIERTQHTDTVQVLEDFCQKFDLGEPNYNLVSATRNDLGMKTYKVKVSVNDKVWGMVEGEKNIKLAMSKVAVLALDGLKKDMKPREESEASKP